MKLNLGKMTITSSEFEHGRPIPTRFSNGGDDISPPLSWHDVPDGARELVVVVHDPDAPLVDGFTHWIVMGIDPTSTGLAEGATDEFEVGENTLGDDRYMGPAPPQGHGVHYYFFHLFALDEPLATPRPRTRAQLLERIDGHIIEQARLVGTFENP